MTHKQQQERRRKFVQKSCLSKLRHATEEAARDHMRRYFIENGEELNVYACRFCGGWHIGHGDRADKPAS